MGTVSKKLPARLFVTAKLEQESVKDCNAGTGWATEDHTLGFLHPHDPSQKGDDARKNTQLEWAYEGEVYKIGDQYWHRGATRVFDRQTASVVYTQYDNPIDPVYAPRIWINEPLSGFKIINTVARDRGNKLFKVLDPRGVEFEITVASLFEIIQKGDISCGVICSPCMWKANKNLVIAT